MKFLLYEWESYLQYDIKWVCREAGITIDTFMWRFADKNEDEEFMAWFSKEIDGKQYDALLSINYWPMLSEAAQKCSLQYLAWCYDNPLNVFEPERTLGNSVNSVFFFDRIQAAEYQQKGLNTVHYLPLGVNTDRLTKVKISEDDRRKYTTDISLVGSLYESKILELRAIMKEQTKGYIDAVMAVQQNIYGGYLLDELVTSEIVKDINQYVKEQNPKTGFYLRKEALVFAMASEITRRERLVLLSLLGKRFDTRIYSFQNSEMLRGVKCCPAVDYLTEMPKVFACTEINLNPILKCIQSGIPLRALDVMGMGGFLLSSWQPELAEQFVDGEEMVLYESLEDAVAKADFYLKNEGLRKKIAVSGRTKVCKEYRLQKQFKKLLDELK